MKTIDELITEHSVKILTAHENNTFGAYTSEGLLAQYTLALIENGHVVVKTKHTSVTR